MEATMMIMAGMLISAELAVLVLGYFLIKKLIRAGRGLADAPDKIRWIVDCPCGERQPPRRDDDKKALVCASCGRAAPESLPRR